MTNASKRIAKLQDEYDGVKRAGGDLKDISDKLRKAKENVTFQDKRYKEMIEDTTDRISRANQIALDYVNEQTSSIYAVNYNGSKEVANKYKMNFTQVDEHTVKNLFLQKHINVNKDKKWNSKRLNSSVLQGILQGESMDKIAKRIMPICDGNKESAIRNARTMVTQAENRGRLDGYKELEQDGLLLMKEWVATEDDRTRESHLEINGEEVGTNEEFSNGLMYPADPNGDASEVYNCRCTMVTNIMGKEVGTNDFKDSLDEAKETNNDEDKWRVDNTKTANDYVGSKLCKLFGDSVVAITPKGDIESLCKNVNGDDRGKDLLKIAKAYGGDRLDAFGSNLYNFYTRNGFEPVSWTPFNEEYAPDDWVKGRDEAEPVIFYKYVGKDAKKIGYDDFLNNTKACIGDDGYENAMKIRDKAIDKKKKKK